VPARTPVPAAAAADGAPAAPAASAAAPAVTPTPTPTGAAKRRYRRIDVHTHIGPDGIARAVRLMDEWGIDGVVNLSGMHRARRAACSKHSSPPPATAGGRIAVFMTPNFKLVRMRSKDYGVAMAASSRRGSASARAASRSPRASASVTSAPTGRSCWPSTIRC
jgi:hypothetical protein